MDNPVVRYVALNEAELDLLQGVLMQAKAADNLSIGEYQALNSLRIQLDLPPVEGL